MLADAKFLFISCNCDDNLVPPWYPQSFECTQGIVPDNLTHQQQQSKAGINSFSEETVQK